ncbi:MAG: hypothetical protein FWF82_04395 [Oscillospiraceae bacterium]|nr:hypothetical protein [Oscillospiraceae bacterium]
MKKLISMYLVSLVSLILTVTILIGFVQSADAEKVTETDEVPTVSIPANFAEAYKALDELLDDEDIEYIKNLPKDEIVGTLHFGLGLWIRNNWLRPDDSPLAEAFFEFTSEPWFINDISSFILTGYHYYLNDAEFSAEEYIAEKQEEMRKEKEYEKGSNLLFFLIFVFMIVIIYFARFCVTGSKKGG